MYIIKRVSKTDRVENHLPTTPNLDVDEYSVYEYEPDNFRKSFLPKGVQGIPEWAEKELKEKGETTFSYTETVTIQINKLKIRKL